MKIDDPFHHSLDLDGDDQISLDEMLIFENNRQKIKEILLIGIYWIGHYLTPEADMDILSYFKDKIPIESLGVDDSEFFPQYELTHLGQPICINEYATEIAAQGPQTHVIQIDDYCEDPVEINNNHLDLESEAETEQLVLKRRSNARSRYNFVY